MCSVGQTPKWTHAALLLWHAIRRGRRNSRKWDDYLTEMDRSQHHGAISLGLLFEELTRCSLLNCFTQSLKLSYALLRLHVMPAFKIVHSRGVDRAKNYLALIEHCELNDHSIEVVALHLALL